jgi:hypothetical protein
VCASHRLGVSAYYNSGAEDCAHRMTPKAAVGSKSETRIAAQPATPGLNPVLRLLAGPGHVPHSQKKMARRGIISARVQMLLSGAVAVLVKKQQQRRRQRRPPQVEAPMEAALDRSRSSTVTLPTVSTAAPCTRSSIPHRAHPAAPSADRNCRLQPSTAKYCEGVRPCSGPLPPPRRLRPHTTGSRPTASQAMSRSSLTDET